MQKRVLLIDGEPLIRKKLCKKLERQDYDVRWASDVQDALQNADIQHTDMLLIDLDVPTMESLEILTRIAEINPSLQVLGLTERTELQAAALGTELSAVVEKPIDEGALLRVMEELLTQSPRDHGGSRLVPRRTVNLQERLPRQPARLNICPAAYSGWGINE
jgi:DNA-binding response OmpR family regulator